jgi:hypothetical protein
MDAEQTDTVHGPEVCPITFLEEFVTGCRSGFGAGRSSTGKSGTTAPSVQFPVCYRSGEGDQSGDAETRVRPPFLPLKRKVHSKMSRVFSVKNRISGIPHCPATLFIRSINIDNDIDLFPPLNLPPKNNKENRFSRFAVTPPKIF